MVGGTTYVDVTNLILPVILYPLDASVRPAFCTPWMHLSLLAECLHGHDTVMTVGKGTAQMPSTGNESRALSLKKNH